MSYLGPSLRREKRRERPARRLAAALVASLVANALAVWALAAAGAFRLDRAGAPSRVALAPVAPSQWEANRRIAGERAAPRPEDEHASGKVVELPEEQKASEKPPDSARFLSDRNTRVEKETVSKHAGNYPRVAPRPEPGADNPAPQPPAQERRAAAAKGDDTGEKGGQADREGLRGDRVAMARPPPAGDLRLPELGQGGDGGRRPRGSGGADLSVSAEALARIAGGPSMDGVGEGLPEGEETWLQAREFKYATYMNRMKQGIGQQWYPRVREAVRERDPDGSAILYKERTVVLGLTIDTEGNVTDLSVLRSSSVDFFDRVAVASVRAAQPFPNPPRGMFHSEGEVRIPFMFTMYPSNGHAALFWRPPTQP
jgi:TonB family protein